MSTLSWLGDVNAASSSSLSFGGQEDDGYDMPSRERETVLLVRNTFLDSASTEGALLADGERAHLLCRRGNRRAATCGAALLAKFTPPPSDSEEDNQPQPEPGYSDHVPSDSGAVHGVADLDSDSDEPPRPPIHRSKTHPLGPICRPTLPIETSDFGVLTSTGAALKITPGEPAIVATRITTPAQPPFMHDVGCSPGPVELPDPLTIDVKTSPTGLDEAQRTYKEERIPVHRGDVSEHVVPSVGSAGHHLRDCKPCAFLDSRKGCVRGFDCPYCHLCEPGEKKRRQKEKRKLFSTARKLQQLTEIAQFGG